jgi:hypothetical protein
MSDLLTYLDQLLDDVKGLGYKITISTSNAAATATTTSEIVSGLGAQESSDSFNNRGVWIPSAAAAADQFRVIAVGGYAFTATGSVVTFTFTNTSNFGETLASVTGYILAAGITPDDIIALFNDALEELTTETYEPVKTIGDSLQGSAVDTDWTESNATDTVDTTASKLGSFGLQVFDVVDSGSGGGYTQMALARIPQGTRGRLHGIVQSVTGTSTLALVDGSGNVQDSIATTQLADIYLGKQVTFDAADEQARLRLVQTTASGEGYWTAAWFTRADQTQFRLPSYLDARYKVDQVVRRQYHDTGTESDTWLADSYEDIPLAYNDDYRFVYRGADGNASHVIFTKQGQQYLDQPLFAVVTSPYSAPYGKSSTFSTYTSTNPAPVRLLVPMVQYLMGRRWPDAFPDAESNGQKRIAERTLPRKNEGRPQPQRVSVPRVRN